MSVPAEQAAAQASPEERISALMNPDTAEPSREEDVQDAGATTEAPEAPEGSSEAAEAQDGPETETVEPDAETIEVGTLAELAEHLGVEVAELYQITVPVTDVDGNRTAVSLGEWKDSYQSSARAQKLQAEVAEQREAAERALTESRANAERMTAEAGALIQTAERQFTKDFERIDWDALRREDPVEWSAKRQEFAEQRAAIEAAKHDVARKMQHSMQQREVEQRRAFETRLAREREALVAALPEWRDPVAADAGRAELRDYLTSQGYTLAEINGAVDHRSLVIGRKAMLYDREMAKANAAKKKVVRIGSKVAKPGAAKSASDQRAEQTRGLRQQARKSGSVEDAARLISALSE